MKINLQLYTVYFPLHVYETLTFTYLHLCLVWLASMRQNEQQVRFIYVQMWKHVQSSSQSCPCVYQQLCLLKKASEMQLKAPTHQMNLWAEVSLLHVKNEHTCSLKCVICTVRDTLCINKLKSTEINLEKRKRKRKRSLKQPDEQKSKERKETKRWNLEQLL